MVESLFYCTPRRVGLSALVERLLALDLIDSINLIGSTKANVYRAEVWFTLHEIAVAEREIFETPQLRVFQRCDIQSVFQIDCRASLLDAIRPHLCAMIRSFDGWIGLDDGSFSTRLTLAELGDSGESLRSAIAIMGEDG
jgi:hypothetical protein